jgi:transposase-like protein
MSRVYNQQEKDEAMKLVSEIGTRMTSERLGISQDTLYTWAAKERKRKETVNAIMAEKGPEGLIAENERLKKEHAALPHSSVRCRSLRCPVLHCG